MVRDVVSVSDAPIRKADWMALLIYHLLIRTAQNSFEQRLRNIEVFDTISAMTWVF